MFGTGRYSIKRVVGGVALLLLGNCHPVEPRTCSGNQQHTCCFIRMSTFEQERYLTEGSDLCPAWYDNRVINS
ncbi:hypothetical protein B0O99DRAFT_612912, partial [Bisporella sp. PMI_857]